jgi:pre-mRNA cleavage complex 2 protein Pcf11
VKNVGTPYTVYLGRNLFSTFMSAYRLVDKPTRRSMEGMLKTWKEPIPGSLDTKPVFDRELWRPIENALIQHKTLDLQGSRQVQTQAQAGYRSTPTPPQSNPQIVPLSLGQTQAQPYYGYGVHQVSPFRSSATVS